jgi:hypothetical protein
MLREDRRHHKAHGTVSASVAGARGRAGTKARTELKTLAGELELLRGFAKVNKEQWEAYMELMRDGDE